MPVVVVPVVVVPVAVVGVVVVCVVDVRLTNTGLGAGSISAVSAAPPPPPVEPTVPSTVETSCGPGRKTTCPSVSSPVSVSPHLYWRSSTPSVVAGCHSSSTTIPSGS